MCPRRWLPSLSSSGLRMTALGQKRKCDRLRGMSVLPSTADIVRPHRHVRLVPNSGLMHRSKQRLYSITSSARVRRQLNSTPSLRTVSACARSPIIVANACSSASSPRASAGTSVNPSGPAASRVDFRRSRLGAKSGAARRLGGKTAQISQGRHRFGRADGKGLGQHPSLDLP